MIWLHRKQLEVLTNYAYDNRRSLLLRRGTMNEVLVHDPETDKMFIVHRDGKTVAYEHTASR